jgi:hypothetical protein
MFILTIILSLLILSYSETCDYNIPTTTINQCLSQTSSITCCVVSDNEMGSNAVTAAEGVEYTITSSSQYNLTLEDVKLNIEGTVKFSNLKV